MKDDTISRAAAIDAVNNMIRRKFGISADLGTGALLELPSATDTNVGGNLIDRQAAISEIMEDIKDRSLHDDPAIPEDYAEGYDEGIRNAAAIVLQMPSAQPDIETLLKLAVAMTKPIEYLNLSVRSYNALKRRGVDSVAKVYELKQKENLKKIRNIGAKSADEIEDCLNAYLAQWEGGQK